MYQRPLTSNEIYHHGILGQKWGKKNGPPYPLDPSDRSAAEKKAARREKVKQGFKNTAAVATATAATVGAAVGVKKAVEEGKNNPNKVDAALKPGKDGKASKVEKITRASNDAVNEMQRANKQVHTSGTSRKISSEAHSLNDKELNARIDRMAREKRYRELKQEQNMIDNGSDRTAKVLDTIGTITVLASSAATIATAIYTIKKG